MGAAMMRLGGSVISTEAAATFSSAAKGESLDDTVRTVEGLCDLLVLRHPEDGAAMRATQAINGRVPIINAGDGAGQHPTQALLDAYTIQSELGSDAFSRPIKVALCGDLAHGRTARSLAYLLTKAAGSNVEFLFVAPNNATEMGDDIKEWLDNKGVKWAESKVLETTVGEEFGADCLYMTRVQRERFASKDEYLKSKSQLVVDTGLMSRLKENTVVMHPLPRLDEISPEVDSHPKAAYFRQAHNGLFIRMALLHSILLD